MLRPRFLQPKVRIILPDRTPDDSEFGRGMLPDDLLAALPWVSDFDSSSPADQAKLRLIIRVSNVKGQTFFVCLATDAQRKALATFSGFPASDEVSAAVAEKHGRDAYNVWSSKPRPQLIRTFHVQGPARRPSANSWQQDRIADLKTEIRADLMEAGLQYLRDHPEMFAELSLGLLCKEIGMPVPLMPTFEQELLNEAMRDPEYREQEAARIMKSHKAEAARAAESQNLDELLAYVKKVKRIAELMGNERNAKRGAGLDDVMKTLLADGALTDILKAFKNVRTPRNPAEARQASPEGDPPNAEDQPKAQNVAHDTQVAEHPLPDRPPQSPTPQVLPAKEKPGGGTGPQRVNIGVPSDSLGLLGLRGDTSFVDRSLV